MAGEIIVDTVIVLHCSLHAGRPVVWGEVPGGDGKARPRPYRSRRTALRQSPFDASADLLDAVLPQVEHGARRSGPRPLVAWLPTIAGLPVPSTPLIAESAPDLDGATLAPWLITARPLTATETLDFVSKCAGTHMLAPGVLVGADLAFWGEALRFGASLVTREQFLPSVETVDDSPSDRREAASGARRARKPDRGGSGEAAWRACWLPVIAGDDARRVHELAERMPEACRAVSDDRETPPAIDPESLVLAFLGETVDALVRGVNAADEAHRVTDRPNERAQFPSVHEAWLAALHAPDGIIAGDPGQLAGLAEQVREWQRPILLAEAAPFRLAFRLEEPAATPASDGNAGDGSSAATVEAESGAPWRVSYLLQSVSDPSLLVPAEEVWAGTRHASALLGRGFQARAHLLRALGQAAALAPSVEASLHASRPCGYDTTTDGAYEFLTTTAWTLQQAGYGVMLPAWWTRKGARARLGLRARVRTQASGVSVLSLDTLLAVDWEAALGGQHLSLHDLEALARFKTPLVRLRGQWVQVTAEDRERAIAFLKKRQATRISAGELVRMALGAANDETTAGLAVAAVDAEGWFADLVRQLEGRVPLEELAEPEGFRGSLRPYQARGYSWLEFLRSWGLGACLADDMGLGKTVQALASMQRDWVAGRRTPVLLVCPTSVVGNWQKEAQRFTPELPVLVHHGHSRARDETFVRQAAAHALVVSSYALLHRDVDLFKQVRWGGVVLDEAQNIKNPETKQARAARALEAGYRVALTGTPVENTVADLWSIMEFLNPGFLGPLPRFRERFLLPIQTGTDPAAAGRLKRITGPFVLRRMKTDRNIIADLPEKQEMKVFCTLTREQASLYAAVVKDAERTLRETEGIQRKGVVLATLSKLKQVCNHPAQFLGDGSPLAGRSGKLARLTEMLEEVAATDERALVFSQFAEMGDLLKRHLETMYGREVLFLHGGVPKAARDRMVERFQSREGDAFVFVLSLKAGGTGLNLTAANHVFLFDRWWNPAVENQAIDRTFRIGQTRDVQVHKFLCAGTLEERIDEMLERKLSMAARVVGTGEGWLTELSTDELKELFALREDAVAE